MSTQTGTRDVGVMQINSSHFPDLEARFHITEPILFERPCINIAVGARILGDFLQKYQGTWRGVGSYGAGMASNKEGARSRIREPGRACVGEDVAREPG